MDGVVDSTIGAAQEATTLTNLGAKLVLFFVGSNATKNIARRGHQQQSRRSLVLRSDGMIPDRHARSNAADRDHPSA
jgi:hypothetical protein